MLGFSKIKYNENSKIYGYKFFNLIELRICSPFIFGIILKGDASNGWTYFYNHGHIDIKGREWRYWIWRYIYKKKVGGICWTRYYNYIKNNKELKKNKKAALLKKRAKYMKN